MDAIDEDGLNQLRSIFTSIKDGESNRETYFTIRFLPEKKREDDDDNVVFENHPKPKTKNRKQKETK